MEHSFRSVSTPLTAASEADDRRVVEEALNRYFERYDPEFVEIVGQVVILASLLEERMLSIVWALEDRPQPERAGVPASTIVSTCRKAASAGPQTWRESLEPFLVRVQHVQRLRNEVVHSVWRRPLMDDAYGWRSVPSKQRAQAHDFTKSSTPTRSVLTGLPVEIINLIDEIPGLTQQAQQAKAARSAQQ